MPNAVIGLEVHVQLNTRSKMFCSCPVEIGAEPNTRACPVCLALPGSLPVINRQAVEAAFAVALALHCRIQPYSQFHRKNYFYPDLPKGYQISQYDMPFSQDGYLLLEIPTGKRRIGIIRVHMEEDTAKMIHGRSISHSAGYSLLDFNRSGVPLLEVVSAPDMTSPGEASVYLQELRTILRNLGVSSGNMEDGALRCDVNISIEGGTRTEIKNLNSFRAVRKALEYEIQRQGELLSHGQPVVQQTLHFDEASDRTIVLRSKEEAEDYRYFPEPDLVPLEVSPEWVEAIRRRMPELPEECRRRLINLGLSRADAAQLAESPETVRFLDRAMELGAPVKETANWLLGETKKFLNAHNLALDATPLTPSNFVALLDLLSRSALSSKGGKAVLEEMLQSGDPAPVIVERLGLAQVSDELQIRSWIRQAMERNPAQVEQYRQGKEAILGFFSGQVMKLSGGKVNPEILQQLLCEELPSSR